jgi:nitrate/nitrite transport system ATP-binding protein
MMITHDVDEAIFMSDKVVMMTNSPNATLGKILDIPLSRPRNAHELRETPEYYELRNQALDFLEKYQ